MLSGEKVEDNVMNFEYGASVHHEHERIHVLGSDLTKTSECSDSQMVDFLTRSREICKSTTLSNLMLT